MKPILFAPIGALALTAAFAPVAAQAQTNNTTPAPIRPGAVPTGAGAVPAGAGAIPLYGTGQYTMRGGQVIHLNPVAPSVYTPNIVNGVIVPPNGSYAPNPYYNNGGGNGTTVIINNNNGYPYNNGYTSYNGYGYTVGGYNNGYSNYNNGYRTGYVTGIAPNPTVVLPGTPVTETVTTAGATSVTLFNGYAPVWTSGQTVLSPFGAFYGTPAYIGARYAIGTPYPYLHGREIAVLNGITVLGYDEPNYAASAPQTGTQAPSEASGGAAQAPNTLTDRQTALLHNALDDVQTFWKQEDVRSLRRRLLLNGTVAVFQNERFAYSLKRADFLALSSDTLDRVQTKDITFKRIVLRDDGLVNAYATHTYRARSASGAETSGGLRTATVRVTFIWDGGDWYVSGVSFAPGSLAR